MYQQLKLNVVPIYDAVIMGRKRLRGSEKLKRKDEEDNNMKKRIIFSGILKMIKESCRDMR